jgi:cytochrome bd-type quinol oxidase subunit 2
MIIAGSWIVAASWGWIFACLLAGATDRVVTSPTVVFAVAAIMTVFALHGLAFTALRNSGELRRRSSQWFGASSERRSFAMTSAVMVALVVVAGSNLGLTASVADSATLDWLVPAILGLTPFLVAAQVWVWRLFGRRITNRPSRDTETATL